MIRGISTSAVLEEAVRRLGESPQGCFSEPV
jgi:hypothetical protein